MEFDILPFLIVCPMVFLGGLVDAIAGGGGLITLPAYILAGVPIHTALATNKMSSVSGAVVSFLRFWKNRYVDVAFMLPSVAMAIAGSVAGARLALIVADIYLQYFLLVVLPVAAYFVLKHKALDANQINSIPRRNAMLRAMAISLAIGVYDGFYGPGTGTFLLLLYASLCKMDVRSANGNAKMVNFSSNVGAFVTFVLSGTVNFQLGLAAAGFSIAGHWIGSGLAIRKGSGVVRPMVLVVLALLFVRMLVNGS